MFFFALIALNGPVLQLCIRDKYYTTDELKTHLILHFTSEVLATFDKESDIRSL